MKGSRFSCAPLKICLKKMNCLLCSEVQKRQIPSDPEGKEVHSGVIRTRGACVVLLRGPKPAPGKIAGQSDSSCAGARRGARSPTPAPLQGTQAGHLSPRASSHQDVPSFPPMAAEEPESLALQGQRQGLAACCRPASQPRACLGHPDDTAPVQAPTVGGRDRGAVGGGERNGIQPGQVARFSLPCDCPKARGLGKLAGTRG